MPLRGGPLGPRLRRWVFNTDRIAPDYGASVFPALGYGPLGLDSSLRVAYSLLTLTRTAEPLAVT